MGDRNCQEATSDFRLKEKKFQSRESSLVFKKVLRGFREEAETIRLTGCQVYWQFGADCWTISFFEKVAVCAGPLKPKRVAFCSVNQDPIGFIVAVARWLPRSHEWMVSVVRWKRNALGQKLDNLLQLLQVLPSFPHAFDIPGKLPGLGDLPHFSQSLNIASNDSNS